MRLEWIRENPPVWDENKARIVGGAPEGIFDLGERKQGEILAGEWWRVEQEGRVLGYGWMDTVWGDAEILLAVSPEARGRGVGSFILEKLEKEARARGLNYLYNVVRGGHPDRDRVMAWLVARGFERRRDDRLLKRVRSEEP
jgi:N-acetylglutamate synthase-like GNAT family acetyltransferase